MTPLAALLVALFAALGQPQPVRAGVMIADAERKVVALEGAPLAPGTPVTVVGLEEREDVWQATIAKQLAASDAMAKHMMAGPFYELRTDGRAKPLPGFGVVIVGRANTHRAGKVVTLHFPRSPVAVRVRSCASSEGLHLTLWAGAPLKSPRLWHAYYYLGYDVEPTCSPADFETADAPAGRDKESV